MAQKKIEFNDKTNAVPVVDRDKQVVADDLNEIKDAVNSNADEVDDINDKKLEKPSSSSQNNIPTFENNNGNKLQDSGKSFENSLSGNADKIPNSQIVKGIKDTADNNSARIDTNYQLILSNGEKISVNEYEIQLLKDNQVTGIVQKNTYADLVATTPVENVSFKVTNDPDTSLNGYYHFEGTNIVKDADLVNGVVEKGNVDAVSGGVVSDSILGVTEGLDSLTKGFNIFPISTMYVNKTTGIIELAGSANYVISGYIDYRLAVGFTIKNIKNNEYTALIGFYDINKNPIGVYDEADGAHDITITQDLIDLHPNCQYIVLGDVDYGNGAYIQESLKHIESQTSTIPEMQENITRIIGNDVFEYELISGVLEPNQDCFDIQRLTYDNSFFTVITNDFTLNGSAVSSEALGTNKVVGILGGSFDITKKYSVAILCTPLTSGNVSAFSNDILGGQIINSAMIESDIEVDGILYKLYQYNFTPLVASGQIQIMSSTFNTDLRKIAGAFLMENDSEESAASQFDAILNNFNYYNYEVPLSLVELTKRSQGPVKQLVVDKNDAGAYQTINDAVSDALDGDTIFIMPGVYDEIINISGFKYDSDSDSIITDITLLKFIHFVGADRDSCVLLNYNGDYNYPPLWMTNGSVSNMSIKTLNDGRDYSQIPKSSYCIHIDYHKNNYVGTAMNRLDLSNCKFESAWNDCLGCGSGYSGYVLSVRNCEGKNTLTGAYLKFHNNYNFGANYIELFDNIGIVEDGDCIVFNTISPNVGDTIEVLAVRNVTYSKTNGIDCVANNDPVLITMNDANALNKNSVLGN